MDAIELLAREDEFKRLNKQLEKKTESLMKEIEHVMQKQDFFSEFSPSLATPVKKSKKHCCTPPSQPDTPIKRNIKKKTLKLSPEYLESDLETENRRNKLAKWENDTDSDSDDILTNRDSKSVLYKNEDENYELRKSCKKRDSLADRLQSKKDLKQNRVDCDCCPTTRDNRNEDVEFLYAFVSLNVKDKVLPPTFSKEDRISVEGVCKFLSSKVKLMQEQIDKLQKTIEKKASQCESHLTQLAELESERMGLLNRTNSMTSSTADMRAKYMATQKRLDDKDRQFKEARSEADKLSCELKRLKSKNANVETRCASQEQAAESLKQQLEVCKRSEKELRDSTRQLSTSYESAISRLEARIGLLTARAEKQAALVTNLRKQNALLIAEGAVNSLDTQYAGLLNQDF